jgi:hypothetical protein
MSPSSNMQSVFRRQVDAFFDNYAKEIWGPAQDPAKLKQLFLVAAKKARAQKIQKKQ